MGHPVFDHYESKLDVVLGRDLPFFFQEPVPGLEI